MMQDQKKNRNPNGPQEQNGEKNRGQDQKQRQK